MLPMPTMPSVLLKTSEPVNLPFSHLPAFIEAVACGMERASASIMLMACSAVVTLLPAGRVHHHDALLGGGVDVDVVDADAGAADDPEVGGGGDDLGGDRRAAADDQPVVGRDLRGELGRLEADGLVDLDVRLPPRRMSMPGGGELVCNENAMHRLTPAGAAISSALRGADAATELDLVAEVAQRHLEGGDGGDDVEGAHVAEMGDADDLALQLILAAGEGHAHAVAQIGDQLAAVDAGGDVHRRSRPGSGRRAPPASGRVRSPAARVAAAMRAWRAKTCGRPSSSIMASASRRPMISEIAGVHAVVSLAMVVALAGEVEVEARQLGLLGALPGALAERDERQARRQHERLLRAGDQHVDAPAVHRDVEDADGGDAVDDEQGVALPGQLRRSPRSGAGRRSTSRWPA